MNTSFQLSLELTKAFSVRAIIESVGPQLWALARDLRRSGSDIVVEVELAETFGRAKISTDLEPPFKTALKNGRFVPLQNGCEVGLDSTPGPTTQNALRNPHFLATVIQLSLLGWMYKREQLASLIDKCMRKQFEMNVTGASPGPGSEGISAMLAACSSQTDSFHWNGFVDQVQERVRAASSNYSYSPDYLRLSPTILLALMDYLYLVPSLPKDRRIMISN